MFESDNHFLIGRHHINSGKPCQDFSLSGQLDGDASYAIVSDGCSTGGHTDVGSRLLAFATAKSIQSQWLSKRKSFGKKIPEEIALNQQIITEGVRIALGGEPNDLLATCIYAFFSSEGGLIHVQGDGVIARKKTDGEIIMTRYDWENNAPCYPAYARDSYQKYIKAQGDDLNAKLLKSETWSLKPDSEEATKLYDQDYALGEGLHGVTSYFPEKSLEETEFFVIFSDGVTQIENLDWKKAVTELLSFKGTKGEFVTRRLNRVVKDSESLGKGPQDDIAFAAIKVCKNER